MFVAIAIDLAKQEGEARTISEEAKEQQALGYMPNDKTLKIRIH